MRPPTLLAVVTVTGMLASCGGPSGREGPSPSVDRFDAAAAMALVRQQVGFGQRTAGSPRLRRLAEDLRPLLPHGRFEDVAGWPGLRNVVGGLPGRRPAILVAAHYDVLASPRGFVGANNGAAGTAVVIEVARAMARRPRPAGARAIDFVLFDGEEPERGTPEQSPDFYADGLRGSKSYAAAHADRTGAVVVADYVGNRGLRLPREASSNVALWAQIRESARAVGVRDVFPPRVAAAIIDDHTPFLARGIPSVDLIDFGYPGHSSADRLDRLSESSLDAVGETLVAFLVRHETGPLPAG